MKAWRERIAEARERGRFTPADANLVMDGKRCLVGEAVAGILGVTGTQILSVWVNDAALARASREAVVAVCLGDAAKADALLDLAEDRALEIKREGRS